MTDVHVKSGTGTADMTVAEKEMRESGSMCERIRDYLEENLQEIKNNISHRRYLQDIMWVLKIPNCVSPFSRSSENPEVIEVQIGCAIGEISEWLASKENVKKLFEDAAASPRLPEFFNRLLDLEEIQFIHRNHVVNGICMALAGSYANDPVKMITTLQSYVKGCARESEGNGGCSSDCEHRFDLMAAVRRIDDTVISYANKEMLSWILWGVKGKYLRWRGGMNTTLGNAAYSWKKLQIMLAQFYRRPSRYKKPSDESFSYESFSFLSCPRDGEPFIYDEVGETEGSGTRQGMSADAARHEVGTAVTGIMAPISYEYLVRLEQVDVMGLLVEGCLQVSSLVWILEPFDSLRESGEGEMLEICRILKKIYGWLSEGDCGGLSKEFFRELIIDEGFREILINMGGNEGRKEVVGYIINRLVETLELLCRTAAGPCESGQGSESQGQIEPSTAPSATELTGPSMADRIQKTSKELLSLLLPFPPLDLTIGQVQARKKRVTKLQERNDRGEGLISELETSMEMASGIAIREAKDRAEKLRNVAYLGSWVDSQAGGDALISVGGAEA